MAERLRTCRVCGCTDDLACPEGCFWLDDRDDLCSACADAQSHVVRMTRRYRNPSARGFSVATCSCGQFTQSLPIRQHRKMDKLVRGHWREIVALAKRKLGAAA
mgnify:CR=1 FL=1